MEELRDHMKKAVADGDPNHVDISLLEGWEETSLGKRVNIASDLEET